MEYDKNKAPSNYRVVEEQNYGYAIKSSPYAELTYLEIYNPDKKFKERAIDACWRDYVYWKLAWFSKKDGAVVVGTADGTVYQYNKGEYTLKLVVGYHECILSIIRFDDDDFEQEEIIARSTNHPEIKMMFLNRCEEPPLGECRDDNG